MNSINNCLIEAKRYEDEGMFDLALEQYEMAISLRVGDQAFAHQGKGRALVHLGQPEEALVECQMALELNPELPMAHSVLGYIYSVQTKYDLAEKHLLIALQLKPDNVTDLANLASLYSNLGRYQEATEFCRKLLQLQPENMEMRAYIAQLYITQSDFQQAIAQLNKILIAKPSRFVIYPLYATLLVNVVATYFGHLNIIARIGAASGLFLVALLAPGFLSIAIGVLLFLLFALIALVNLWQGKNKSKFKLLFLFVSLAGYCIFYWLLVWLNYNSK